MALRWLLDTNLVSEGVRPHPDPNVMVQLHRFDAELAIPATVLQELLYGWLRLDEGRSRERIGQYLREVVTQLPVIDFDARAARVQAELRLDADRRGRPMGYPDSEIAAIAIANDLTLVTRNTRDFIDRPGLKLADWHSPGSDCNVP